LVFAGLRYGAPLDMTPRDADCWRNEHQMQRNMVTRATLARGKAARLWRRWHRRSLVPLMCMPRTTIRVSTSRRVASE
jgi:hypothetical protein